jgi:hypothetical protein
MTTPADVVSFRGFPRGLDNRRHETEALEPNEETLTSLRVADNIDITQTGNLKRRKGYSQVIPGYAHSLYSHRDFPFLLAVVNGGLRVYDQAFNVVATKPVSSSAPVAYSSPHAGDVYWTNGVENGRVDRFGQHRRWGLPVPPFVSYSVVSGGAFSPGKYLLSQRYISSWGEVSGASEPIEVSILSVSSYLYVSIPSLSDPDIAGVEVFCTTTNGDALYHIGTFPLGATVSLNPSNLTTGFPLDTVNLSPPLPGSYICSYRGRIYVARDNMLFATEPLHYGLVDYSKSVLLFPSPITMLYPVADGLYVACDTEGVSFLSGADITDFEKRIVERSEAVVRANAVVPGEYFELPGVEVLLWWSKMGYLCLGAPGGQVKILTRDRLIAPSYLTGAVGLVEHDGLSQVLSILKDPSPEPVLQVVDRTIRG